MDEFWNNVTADQHLPIIGQPELSSADDVTAKSWPSVPEWVHDDAMLKRLGPEFAARADLPPDESTRRHFLQIMGASMALAASSGCFQQPQEKIVPYVRPPEQLVPGKPLYYATAMTLGGGSMGLLVETHMGRPTKVEGNPLHPAVPEAMLHQVAELPGPVKVGATDAFAQAQVLSLYDPDRSQTVLRHGQISTWDSCYAELREQLDRLASSAGQGLRLLTESVVSPTLGHQIAQLLAKFPKARWHQFEPINDDNALLGSRLAYDEDIWVDPSGAKVVLSLDADCFGDGPMKLSIASELRGQGAVYGINECRMYVVETSSTITGAAADHRLPLTPRGVLVFALAVAQALGLETTVTTELADEQIPEPWLDAVVEDLRTSREQSLVLAGRAQPPVVHALAHWLNTTLGNVGQTVHYPSPGSREITQEVQVEAIGELVRAMRAEEVAALVMLGGNPAYNAPADLDFAGALRKVPFSLHLSQYADETSAQSLWHVPESHLFETWSDTRAVNGIASIVQPVIAPLYESRTVHEFLAAMLGNPSARSHDIVRDYWIKEWGEIWWGDNENDVWKSQLHDGYVDGTGAETRTPSLRPNFAELISEQLRPLLAPSKSQSLHLVFRPDPSVWDGRFANNAWLQEVPRPITKLTWDNAALMSPQTANEHRIKTGDVVEIEVNGQRVELPACVVPGHPAKTITLHLGYGRQRAGRVGNQVGANVYPLRTTGAMWFAEVTGFSKTGRRVELASTQHHHHMHGRDLVRAGTLAQYRESPNHPAFMQAHGHGDPHASMYPQFDYNGYKWGMVVNQSACIGCNACVVACQAENNTPVVGKDQVARGREMHWLRIDNYFRDRPNEPANPTVYHQPVMCQHCELAPCEPVCPVMATTHSAEGLNEMTYNRCVGTRYCSNNCPYKVRRFNFYDYNGELREDPTLHLLPNPDVTVRSRGVMEKCTYCVQRINAGRIAADIGNRAILDGEVLTACQAACPTQAITFGNLNDDGSAVRKLADSSLNYSLLAELNTRPRTTYLAVVRNSNPELNDYL
jgi:molybdopterin-containing oxidoreductase family iron-sulfur binding subunit